MSSSEIPPFDHSVGYKLTETPNPSWTWGDRVETTAEGKAWADGEKEGWKVVDGAEEDPRKMYALMISGIVPRPIAFVSSISNEGVENLAPFSWFNMVTSNPPTISIAISKGPEHAKDSTNNIKSGNGFTVNIISEPWVEQANAACVNAPPDVSEWELSGLTKAPSLCVKAARVKESAFSMECELFQLVDIIHPVTKVNTSTLVLGLVKKIHVRNDVLNERGVVDPAKFKPVGRLGDISYTTLAGEGFRMPRFVWADEEQKIEEILKEKETVKAHA